MSESDEQTALRARVLRYISTEAWWCDALAIARAFEETDGRRHSAADIDAILQAEFHNCSGGLLRMKNCPDDGRYRWRVAWAVADPALEMRIRSLGPHVIRRGGGNEATP